jgi:hypothetical protein
VQRLHVIQNKQILYTVKNKDIEYNWGLDVKESRSESKGVMQRLECKTIQVIGKWSELRKSERRKPKRTPKIDFRRSDLL